LTSDFLILFCFDYLILTKVFMLNGERSFLPSKDLLSSVPLATIRSSQEALALHPWRVFVECYARLPGIKHKSRATATLPS